jgi:glycosyltransferase involved in cell wall biosynthesis
LIEGPGGKVGTRTAGSGTLLPWWRQSATGHRRISVWRTSSLAVQVRDPVPPVLLRARCWDRGIRELAIRHAYGATSSDASAVLGREDRRLRVSVLGVACSSQPTRVAAGGHGQLPVAVRRDRFLAWRREEQVDGVVSPSFDPSDHLREGISVSLLEATTPRVSMVPPVTGGTPALIGEGAGFTMPAKDAEASADALLRLAQDATPRARVGNVRRRRSEARHAVEHASASLSMRIWEGA